LILPPIPSQCLLSSQGSQDPGALSRSAPGGAQSEHDERITYPQGYTGSGLGLTRSPKEGSAVKDQSNTFEENDRSRGKQLRLSSFRPNSRDGSEAYDWYRPDDLASTTRGGDSFAQYDILSGFKDNRNLSTLLRDVNSKADGEDVIDENMQSATEVVTPSFRGTPDLRTLGGFDRTISSLYATVSDLKSEVYKGPERGPRSVPHSLPATWNEEGRTRSIRSLANQPSSALPAPTNTRHVDGLISTLHHLLPQLDHLVVHLRAHPAIESLLRGLSHRLEVLENPSFSMGHLDDIPDRLDLFDGRITEVEGSIEELTKWRTNLEEDVSSTDRLKEYGQANRAQVSLGSEVSLRSNSPSVMITAALGRTDAYNHLQTLEARVASLEAGSMPSLRQPWTVEVILLPWGRNLRGLWYPAEHFPNPRSQQDIGEDFNQSNRPVESSQELRTQRKSTTSRTLWNNAAIQKWATDTDTWLMAKACGPNSTVYKRLKSSGCIQQVSICGGSAKDIETALESALGKTLNVLENHAGSQLGPSSVHGGQNHQSLSLPLGLGARFVPLRKQYKVSRLQFLNNSELTSSTIWNAEFLQSGAMMNPHKGLKTLYLTTRESYLQSARTNASWNWHDLKELSLSRQAEARKASSAIQLPGEEELDGCWQWDPRLDPALSTDSSFQSHGTGEASSSSQSRMSHPVSDEDFWENSEDSSEYIAMHNDAQRVEPISPQSEFPIEQASQRRLIMSMKPGEEEGTISKRPNSIYGEESRNILNKRPRLSEPHKLELVQSPFFDEASRDGASRSSRGRRRGVTPTAYATPYSGTVLMDRRGSDGYTSLAATNDDEDDGSSGNDQVTSRIAGDEAWEGVKEENTRDEIDCGDDQGDESEEDDADDDLDAMCMH
jgi:hypothetical protein